MLDSFPNTPSPVLTRVHLQFERVDVLPLANTQRPVLARVLLRFERVDVLTHANTPSPVLARVLLWFERVDVLPLSPRLPQSHVVYSQTTTHSKEGIYFGIVTEAVALNPSRD